MRGSLSGARQRARRALAVALAAGLTAVPAASAHAQVLVDRMDVEFRARPTAETAIVKVQNVTNERLQAEVKLEDWKRTEYGDNQWLALGSLGESCRGRLRAFPEALLLEPNGVAELRITMEHPAGASRECWSAVLVESSRVGRDGNRYVLRTAVKTYGLPAATALAGTVSDVRIVPHAQLALDMARNLGRPASDLRVPAEVASRNPLMVEVVFDNTGNRHVIARGRVEFRRPDGGVQATLPLQDVYVLPGARGRAIAPLPALPPGEYAVLAILDYGGDELAAMQLDYRATPR